MKSEILVQPWHLRSQRFDGFISAVGYEKRSTHAAKTIAALTGRFACGFSEQQGLHYSANRAWYERAKFEIAEVSDSDFHSWVTYVANIFNERRASRIAVDISSFSRMRIAILVAELLSAHQQRRHMEIVFLYSPGRKARRSATNSPIASAAPVLPRFAGWTSAPDLPTAGILGLGCDPDRAAGVIEFVEAAMVWAFRPIAGDDDYDKAVQVANQDLLLDLPGDCVSDYRVRDPFGCFVQLESLVYGLRRASRIVIIPFGPKVFALCSLLVATIYSDVGVWRVSPGVFEPPVDRVASGEVVGVQIERGAEVTSGVRLHDGGRSQVGVAT